MKTKVKVLLLLISMTLSTVSAWADLTLEPGAKYYLKHGGLYVGKGMSWVDFHLEKSGAITFTITDTGMGYTLVSSEGSLCIDYDYNDLMYDSDAEWFTIEGTNASFSLSYFNTSKQKDYYISYNNIIINITDSSKDTEWSIEEADGEGGEGGGSSEATRTLCRLMNASNNVFLAAPTEDGNGTLVTGGYKLGATDFTSTNYNTLWYAETTDEGATYKLVHANSGYYLIDSYGQLTLTNAKNDALVVSAPSNSISYSGSDYTITFIEPVDNPIEYTLNGSGIGTLCLPFDFYASNMADNLTANIITGGTSDMLNLTAIDCSQVAMKKKEGYIMVGKPGGTYTISPEDNQETADTDGNLLSGSLCSTQMTPNSFYGLKTTDGTEGKLGSAVLALATTSAIPANKAYLNASNISSGISQFVLNFNDEESTTAIKQLVNHSYQQSAAYDLAGRRVIATCKGISIANGKKVIK